jgi:hypothetical protein
MFPSCFAHLQFRNLKRDWQGTPRPSSCGPRREHVVKRRDSQTDPLPLVEVRVRKGIPLTLLFRPPDASDLRRGILRESGFTGLTDRSTATRCFRNGQTMMVQVTRVREEPGKQKATLPDAGISPSSAQKVEWHRKEQLKVNSFRTRCIDQASPVHDRTQRFRSGRWRSVN